MKITQPRIVAAVALALLAPTAWAQPPAKVARIGLLVTSPLESPEGRRFADGFRQGLRERGYAENQNIVVEYRSADGRIDRFPAVVAELVRLKVDLIVAGPTPAGRAAQKATSTIPIVVAAMGDPVGDGLVASLARPGGNVTGLTFLGPELVPKRLALLKEVLPKVSKVAVLWDPGSFSDRTTKDMLRETEAAARTLGVHLRLTEVRGAADLEGTFATLVKERADAFLVSSGSMFFAERRRIVALATRHGLPGMYNSREFVELGGLIAYGASLDDLIRRAATYVDRILKGARPAELPVEQPTKFELAINLKTAKTLGLTIPESVLVGADHVIQ